MGFDSLDIMAGLAAGGQAFAAVKDERRKEALAERLEKERRQYENDREIAREQRAEKRALAEPKTTVYQDGEDGVLWTVIKNKNNDVLEKRLATADEREQRNYEHAQRTTGIDLLNANARNAEATAQINTDKAAHLDEYRGLETEVKRAQADKYNAEAERARRAPAAKPDKAATLAEDRAILGEAESRIQAGGNTPELRKTIAQYLASKEGGGRTDLAYKIDPNWNRTLKEEQ